VAHGDGARSTDGDRRYVAYTVLRDKDGTLRTALGFETKPPRLRHFSCRRPTRRSSRCCRARSPAAYNTIRWGRFIITDRYGVEIYRTAVQYTSPSARADTIGTDMGDLYAQVALREAMADKLIIGGLPKSRLPLILGLLGLTAH